jgi:hypothetical protein
MRSDSIRPSRRFLLPSHGILLACVLLAGPAIGHAQSPPHTASPLPANWNDAVISLAGQIAGLAEQGATASLEIKNISSLDAADVSEISQALQGELAQRLHLATEAAAETQITVTLSENIAGYVWVAEVRGKNSKQTAIVTIPQEARVEFRGERATLSLERKAVWRQPEPFLDFALDSATPAGIPQMIVLEPARVVSYESHDGKWMPAATIALHPTAALPRDVRGMIWEGTGELELFLPGESCSGMSSSILSLSCAPFPSTNPEMNWPLVAGGSQRVNATFQTNRNFFDGMTPGGGQTKAKLPAFYTAAATSAPGDANWLVASLDGRTRLYDGAADVSATFSGWGDGIAALQSGCSADAEVLATGTGDWTQPDHVQMYEIRDRQALAAGPPLDFPGPILALWPSTDLKSARVVSRNLQTGMYEASIISVSCGE